MASFFGLCYTSCHAFGAQLFLQLQLVSDSEHRCILSVMLHCFFGLIVYFTGIDDVA